LRADALEQGDDLLRLAPTRRSQPDHRRWTVEPVEITDDRLLLLHSRLTREARPARLEQVAEIPRFPAARLESPGAAGVARASARESSRGRSCRASRPARRQRAAPD